MGKGLVGVRALPTLPDEAAGCHALAAWMIVGRTVGRVRGTHRTGRHAAQGAFHAPYERARPRRGAPGPRGLASFGRAAYQSLPSGLPSFGVQALTQVVTLIDED